MDDQQNVSQPKWTTRWNHSCYTGIPWLSALHCLQQLQSGACSSSTTQPLSLTLDPNASSSSSSTPNPQPPLSSIVSHFTSGLTRDDHTHCATTLPQQTPPRNSLSRSLCSCVLPNTPSRAQVHFGCMKIIVMHRPPARGKSRLLTPPRSSLLPSSSNGTSSPKPSRRALSHLPNPSTWARFKVSAAPVAVTSVCLFLVCSPTAYHLCHQDSRMNLAWLLLQVSLSTLRPCDSNRNWPFALTSTGATSMPTLQPQVSTTQVGKHTARSSATHKRSAGTAPAGTHSAIGADPRAGCGPVPKPRPAVLPMVRFGLPKPAGIGHLHNADSDLMHHHFRLSILQWNPGTARRNPTQIIAATCGRFHAAILHEASDHVLHISDQFIAYTGNTDLAILLNKDTFEPNPSVYAFNDVSTSKK